jgi:UDP-N-acetylmuramyl pentapeptide phosphotransferase/UDP-N-acetylglucosamine-1-phosphate transferase
MRPTLIKIRKHFKYLIVLSISLFLSIFITSVLTRNENLNPNPIYDVMGLKFLQMGLSGIEKNYFNYTNDQNFFLQTLSFRWLFIKSNLSKFSDERPERLSSSVLPLKLNFILFLLKFLSLYFTNLIQELKVIA